MTDLHGRHVGVSVIEGYLAQGLDGALAVPGDPPGRILINAHRRLLSLRVPASGQTPDVTTFQKLDIDIVHDEGSMWHEMSVQIDDNVGDVYSVLCLVLDRMQLHGDTFSEAVEEVLSSLAEILAARQHLTREQEVGLAGELLVLLTIADRLGPDQALSSWRGPAGEEHDFGLADSDLEVKVTLSEARHHWITGLTQLVPTGSRPLHLVSIQLTRAGVSAGTTLPELISAARSVAGMPLARLDTALRGVGYRDADADLYSSRWMLRTPPAFYHVGVDFPAITTARLNASVPDAHRIIDVRYRVDLTGMTAATPLFSITMPLLEGGRRDQRLA